MIIILLASLLGFTSPESLLQKTIRGQNWCKPGISIDRIALSKPWDPSTRKLIILTEPPIGNIRFEAFESRVSGTAIVRCMENVAVAARDLSHAEMFNGESVRLVAMEVSKYLRSGFYRDLSELKEQEARGFIRAGTLLTRMQVQKKRSITAGREVQIVLSKGGLKMTARGRALQSGSEDDWIRVENIATRKILTGKVVGGKVVVGSDT